MHLDIVSLVEDGGASSHVGQVGVSGRRSWGDWGPAGDLMDWSRAGWGAVVTRRAGAWAGGGMCNIPGLQLHPRLCQADTQTQRCGFWVFKKTENSDFYTHSGFFNLGNELKIFNKQISHDVSCFSYL